MWLSVPFSMLLVLHGLVHLMGFAKAFGYADLPQLTASVSRPLGLVWLAAAGLMVAAAASLWAWPRGWWLIGAVAVVVSQAAIATAWSDAKFGTVANVLVLAGVVFGWLSFGPGSLRAQYESDVDQGLARLHQLQTITEADIARLPTPVQRYLRLSGVVGRPRVQNVRVRTHGRIRSGPDDPWMPFRSEQFNFYDRHSRFFYMTASRMALPIQGLHRFTDGQATMLVKLASAVTVAEGHGEEMTTAETVTLLNDMCLFAPATLVDGAITWTTVDDHRARARFTHAGRTIAADLVFNEAGELVDFVSDDRRQSTGRGAAMRQLRWSTPVHAYGQFGDARLIAHGSGLWHAPEGDYAYIELTIDDITYNVAR